MNEWGKGAERKKNPPLWGSTSVCSVGGLLCPKTDSFPISRYLVRTIKTPLWRQDLMMNKKRKKKKRAEETESKNEKLGLKRKTKK